MLNTVLYADDGREPIHSRDTPPLLVPLNVLKAGGAHLLSSCHLLCCALSPGFLQPRGWLASAVHRPWGSSSLRPGGNNPLLGPSSSRSRAFLCFLVPSFPFILCPGRSEGTGPVWPGSAPNNVHGAQAALHQRRPLPSGAPVGQPPFFLRFRLALWAPGNDKH